jgi:ribonuclease HI
MKKQKFYVVWKGRRTGIFESWDECQAQINRFADAKYKSFKSGRK